MPSEPRPKPIPFAKAAPAKDVDAALAADKDFPEGASVGTPPTEGVWYALVTDGGNLASSGGNPIRVP